MFGLSRRTLIAVAAAFWLGFVAWLLLSDSDEEKIRARLDQLAHVVGSSPDENMAFRALRLKSKFEELLALNVALAAPELPTTTGRTELTQLAASASRLFGEFSVSIGDTEITIDKKRREANAVSAVTLTSSSTDYKREERRVRFTFHEYDGEWQVSRIDVEERRAASP